FFAGADSEAGAGVDAAGAGVGARTASHHETLTQDGDDKACDAATAHDQRPPDGCGALLRVTVAPVVRPQPPPSAARGAAPRDGSGSFVGPDVMVECPAEMASVRGGVMGLGANQRKVASFCLDVAEVSDGEYDSCIEQGNCSAEGLKCGAESAYYTAQHDAP